MMISSLLLVLHLVPASSGATFLTRDAPRNIHLVEADVGSAGRYQGWSPTRLQEEYERIEALRPGLFIPLGLILFGGTGLGISLAALASELSSFFGIAIGVAIGLTMSIVICVGLVVIGTILVVRSYPERRTLGRQLDAIDEARPGAWLNRNNPCREPPTVPAPGALPPQVMGPATPFTLAVF